ncbi:MAG: Hsp33 family molecular chaperone HslO [Erysipelotrichaceae bacterium]
MDTLVKALALKNAIRVIAIDSTELVKEACHRHQTLPTASAALGRTLSMTAILGSMLKNSNEKVTVQINGKGPLGTILCDANGKGEVRGFVANPEVHFINEISHKLDVGKAVGIDGTLKVIRDYQLKEDFTGTVDLQTGEIGEDFAYYFTVSEQTPSAVLVGVLISKDNEVLSSGALLIQMMPNASETDLLIAEDVVKHLKPISQMIYEGFTPESMINAIFDDVEILSSNPVRFVCSCSHDRMQQALTTLDKESLISMINDDKGCEIVCHFCNTAYQFNEDELKALQLSNETVED